MGSPDFSSLEGSLSTIFDPMDLVSNRAGSAALNAQKEAAKEANATQLSMFNTIRADSQPWLQAGTGALSELTKNDFMKNFQGDPGYAFRLAEGNKAINAAASARGNANSGATMKALTRYGQDYASNEYNNAYNREYGRLSSLAGIGQAANTANNNSGMNYANYVSGNQMGIGNSIAANNIANSNGNKQMFTQGATMAAMLASDERLKTNLKEIDKSELDEMKSYLKAYAFNYKTDEFGTGDWVGIMAQDLEKSKLGKTLVVHDEQGRKMIDIKKVLSMFLATMAEA